MSLDIIPARAVSQWLRDEVPAFREPDSFAAAPRILVAGCGTGAEAIGLAMRIRGARVTAIDLSLASLGHAQRKANELELRNIEFLQGDLLAMDALPGDYDIVHCTGVLHHMADPAAGARALRRRMRPGGLALLGFYSERARADINVAREEIRRRALPATAEAIRAYRGEILAAPPGSPLSRLTGLRDFYSMSGCRDLLFHVQEHQFRLPQLAALLADTGFRVLNLASHLPLAAAQAFSDVHGDANGMDDLLKWDAVEARHPEVFTAMIQLWCQAS